MSLLSEPVGFVIISATVVAVELATYVVLVDVVVVAAVVAVLVFVIFSGW